MINWIPLNSLTELQQIVQSGNTAVILKHSTRCPVSSMAKRNLEFDKDLIPENSLFYYLDLIEYREISNEISKIWNIRHESPQILIVKGDNCLYHASHSDIEMHDIITYIS